MTLIEAAKLALEHGEFPQGSGIIRELRQAISAAEQDCNHCGGTGDVSGEYPGVGCPECNGSGVQVQPEFIKHAVENAEDWSEWVCPDPQSYLMKCCDCGLVHEAQFRVAKYQPKPSEEFVVADDPDLQAQFRMRRNEEWSPKDTAYRPGGLAQPELTLDGLTPTEFALRELYEFQEATGCDTAAEFKAQPDQEPVAWVSEIAEEAELMLEKPRFRAVPLYTTPPQRTWVGLTDEEIEDACWTEVDQRLRSFARAIEAKLKEKNT